MVIKNKLLKLSSLCLIGAVSFAVNKFAPSDKIDATSSELIGESQQSEVVGMGNYNESGLVISEILADADAQNTFEEKVEEKKDEEFEAALPGLEGLEGMKVSRSAYANLAIANVEKELIIRDEAKENAKIVGKLIKDGGCYVLNESQHDKEKWCKVQSGRVVGFAQSKYLIRGDAALEIMKKAGKYYAIAKDKLKVRGKASTNSEELFMVDKGEALQIDSVKGDWVEVQPEISEDKAYVAKDYVDIMFQLKQANLTDEFGTVYSSIGMSSYRTGIMSEARSTLGVPYVWGGTNLDTGVDCSGFVLSVYRERAGITLPRTAAEQSTCGVRVSEDNLKPGDLVFYKTGGKVTHVGIYAGPDKNGVKKIIHAPQRGDVVKYTNMNYSSNRFYKRILDY